MNICPACYQHLAPIDYEGFRVLQCTSCKGHLVQVLRLNAIKATPSKSTQSLKAEAKSDFKGSTARILRCPRCRKPMRKQPLNLPALEAQADFCPDCSLIWLDPGELALIQIAYEASSKFSNIQELKRRVHAVEADPERKAAFEANLAHLPETQGSSVENIESNDLETGATVIDTISNILLHHQ